MIVVSKCLAGEPCRYDGGDNLVPEVRALVERGEAIAVCPEVLGGLPTPRTPSEIQTDGRVRSKQGEDVTEAFLRGAERAMEICRENGCTAAILKARSPSNPFPCNRHNPSSPYCRLRVSRSRAWSSVSWRWSRYPSRSSTSDHPCLP